MVKWINKIRPPKAPEQLKDPRRLTDGLAPETKCLCTERVGNFLLINPKCPIHNMVIEDEL